MAYGEGSIFESKNRAGKKIWQVEIVTGHRADGRPITTRRTAHSLQDARKLRVQLNASKISGTLTQQHNETVAEYGRYWARNVKSNHVKPSTASGYEWLFRKYVVPYLGRRKIADLNYKDITDWINNLLQSGLGPSTVNSARAVLGQICKQAVRQGILASSPVALTEKVRKQNGDKTQVCPAWTKDEVAEVLKAAEGSEMDLFIHLCLLLGLRHGEALGLKWDAVDFEKRSIAIKYTLKDERRETETGRGVVRLALQDPKTKSSIRNLPISPKLFASFERHKMSQSVRKMQAGDKWKESGMVFTSEVGTGVYQANNRNFYYRFLDAQGIRRIRIHDIRHTFGTIALESKAPIEAVSQAMGHSDIGITKKIYAPDVRGLNERAVQAFEEYVSPEIVLPDILSEHAELITTQPLEVVQPVQLSKRPNRAQIDYRRKIRTPN
jgi:integrase